LLKHYGAASLAAQEFLVTRIIESPKRPKIVGTFIRQRREVLNLSQRALGLLFDPPVTTQFISNVERGVTPLPPAHVPTLTRALQVSEADMMGLLEKEYTLKLSGRLGLPQESAENGRGAVIIPLNSGMNGHGSGAAHDLEFIQGLYEAFRAADPKARQAFTSVCQSILNLRINPSAGTAATAQAIQATAGGTVVLSSGERPQS
jgi:transcriptional regulator with XRE-family HTH domain